MYIKIQISDATYASLLNGTSRIQGSIGLVNPTEGNFNAHRRWRAKPGTQYMKLPHGRISVTDEDVRMNSASVVMKWWMLRKPFWTRASKQATLWNL